MLKNLSTSWLCPLCLRNQFMWSMERFLKPNINIKLVSVVASENISIPKSNRSGSAGQSYEGNPEDDIGEEEGLGEAYSLKGILMCCIIWFRVKTGVGNQITNFRFCTRVAPGKLGKLLWTKENNIQRGSGNQNWLERQNKQYFLSWNVTFICNNLEMHIVDILELSLWKDTNSKKMDLSCRLKRVTAVANFNFPHSWHWQYWELRTSRS